MISGCGATDSGEAGTPSGQAERSADSYTGPWAEAFGELAANTDLEFALDAIADSRISDQEAEEARAIAVECYEARGYKVEWDAYGYEVIERSDPAEEVGEVAMAECSFADGGVLVLYYQMMVNPDNEDLM